MISERQQTEIFQGVTTDELKKKMNVWLDENISNKINAKVDKILFLEHGTLHVVLILYSAEI